MIASSRDDSPDAADAAVLAQESVPDPPTDEIEYKIAATREERESAFRLVYRAYTQTGLVPENPCGIRVTPYHLLPTTDTFNAVYDQRVICTVSLIADGEMGVPMASIFGPEIDALRAKGSKFGEVSCLADRRRQLARTLPVFVKLTRLMAQYSRHHGMDRFLIAVHPRHARFYRRFMGFQQIGDLRTYPSVQNKPAVACCLDFEQIDRERPACYDHFFGERIPDAELQRTTMTPADRDYFRPASEHAGSCLQIASD